MMYLELINKKIFENIKEDNVRLVMLSIAEEAYNKGFNEGYEKGSKSILEISQLSQKLMGTTKYESGGKLDQKSYI